MKQKIKELNKEIRNLKRARGALKILKYGAWGGTPFIEDKTFMNTIKNLDRKFVDEINEHQQEIDEIKVK